MASSELNLRASPKREDNINSVSCVSIPCIEVALKALNMQSDMGHNSLEMMQHTGNSRCIHISENNTESEIKEIHTCLSSIADQESIFYANIPEGKEVNAIAGEKIKRDINKYLNLNTSSTNGNMTEKMEAETKVKMTRFVSETAEKVCTLKEQYMTVEEIDNQSQSNHLEEIAQSEKELLKKELNLLQCPCTWSFNYENINKEYLIAERNLALNEENIFYYYDCDSDEQEENFKWRRFINNLVLCHEYYICRNFSEALAKQQECENVIEECELYEKSDPFFQNIKEALMYVVNACKCHLLVSRKMFNDAVKLLQHISRLEDMDQRNRAAIFGIQSSMHMKYGFEGKKAAVKYAKKAINLDENEAKWHFMYGELLGRIRRIENFAERPSQEELSALEQAVETSRKGYRIVLLAQTYREAALRAHWSNEDNPDSGDSGAASGVLYNKSLQLFREALSFNKKSAGMYVRCAAGFLKMPPPFQDLEKAEESIKKALKMKPNNVMANHVAGNLYESLSKNELAESYYKKASDLGAYGANMDLLKLKMKMDKTFDPLPGLQEVLQRFTENVQVQDATLQIGSYYYYFKNDLFTALDYWMKAIKINPNAAKLKTHKSSFLKKTTINLYQVIVDKSD